MIEVAVVSICRETNTKFYRAALSLPKRTRAWRTGGSSSSGRNRAGIPLSLRVGIYRVAARRDAHWAACIRWNAVSRRACVSLRCTQPALCLFLFLCRSLAPRDPRACRVKKGVPQQNLCAVVYIAVVPIPPLRYCVTRFRFTLSCGLDKRDSLAPIVVNKHICRDM